MSIHTPVLLKEVSEYLNIQPGDIVLDATLGGGGHSTMIANKLNGNGVLIGIDADNDAIERAKSNETLNKATCKKHFIQSNFRNLDEVLAKIEISSVDKILFDLGWSSDQFSDPKRGFSFQEDGPLDMRLGDDARFIAGDIINSWEEDSIVDILKGYGEERYAKKIAKAIIIARSHKKIETTLELVEIIKSVVPGPYNRGRINPATKTFQALRIAVNDELGALREGIEKGWQALSPGGRMAIISFHSIEDRIVKRFFRDISKEGEGKLLTKKPVIPTDDEIAENKKARSAKLRVIEKF